MINLSTQKLKSLSSEIQKVAELLKYIDVHKAPYLEIQCLVELFESCNKIRLDNNDFFIEAKKELEKLYS